MNKYYNKQFFLMQAEKVNKKRLLFLNMIINWDAYKLRGGGGGGGGSNLNTTAPQFSFF